MNIQDMIRKNIREILEEEEARKKCAGCDCDEPDPDEDEEEFTREDTKEERKPSYLLKVIPGANMPEKWHPDKRFTTGVECDGYIAIMFKDGVPFMSCVNRVSKAQMENAFMYAGRGLKQLMAAAVIADAKIRMDEMLKAADIAHELSGRINQLIKGLEEEDEDDD